MDREIVKALVQLEHGSRPPWFGCADPFTYRGLRRRTGHVKLRRRGDCVRFSSNPSLNRHVL